MGPDDTVWLTDDGDHSVRQCTLDGRVLMTLGTPGKPAPFMSGEPFHRCTHTALSPKGEIYVSDGYGNARVHKYAPNGKLLLSWGASGTDPGEFNIVHNIACDADGWVYVADRENHRVQVFDGNGRYEAQWNNLHRPCGLYMPAGKLPDLLHRRTRSGHAGQSATRPTWGRACRSSITPASASGASARCAPASGRASSPHRTASRWTPTATSTWAR